jgi:hypothetical protein
VTTLAPQTSDQQVQKTTKAAAKASTATAAQSPEPLTKPEPPKSPEKAALTEKTPPLTVPQSVEVTFVLLEPDAKQVAVCGDFNGWASHQTPMRRRGDGLWETTVALAPGRYEYKFLVDGHWIPDPLAHHNVWNYHGTLNSVIEIRA